VQTVPVSKHCQGTRAYAGPSPVEGNTKRRFFAGLQLGVIQASLDSARAAILTGHRTN
jgi:hypothetical protein